ncbi:hypothetical protein QTI51_09590 [Variovorax sp. J22G73]|uniref:glycoside hydrolase family protein n=1 Tax=unclassified Variovorax TaxID=663243 RepID=UPI0025776928|nr:MULTISPECIES: hypothetical protein [unclassified Variovorax]MDM0006448.1 hypothetical protein [Variovorax sp. J22R203]MDM0097529.1 hypothetical protein [Variovorax sp. J22G73]
MNTPDPIHASDVMDQALAAQIDKMTAQGTTQTDAWRRSAEYRPAGGWDMDSINSFMRDNAAVTQPFQGAKTVSGNWIDQTKSYLGAEGFVGSVYKDPKGYRTIGRGWNLDAHSDAESRAAFAQAGISDYDAIISGKRSMTVAEGDQLRDVAIYGYNKLLDQLITVPLEDYQRAPLVSMIYNFGQKGLKNTGIPDAINRGEDPHKIAEMIANAGSVRDKAIKGLPLRRRVEADGYLGLLLRNSKPTQIASAAPADTGAATGDMSLGFVNAQDRN